MHKTSGTACITDNASVCSHRAAGIELHAACLSHNICSRFFLQAAVGRASSTKAKQDQLLFVPTTRRQALSDGICVQPSMSIDNSALQAGTGKPSDSVSLHELHAAG